MTMYLGIEIGGTKLQLALGDDSGSLAATWREETGSLHAEPIREQIEVGIPKLLERASVTASSLTAVGIGFGGPVDDASATAIKSHQVEGWNDYPIAAWIETLLGLPTFVGNDADLAGLGEATHGAGRGCDSIFYITIGSGIGGGYIREGAIVRGCGRGAAEIGHLHVPIPEPSRWELPVADTPVTYGRLEHVASGWALQQRAQAAARAYPERARALLDLAGGEVGSIRVPHVGEAARVGDEVSCGVLEYLVEYLSVGISRVVTLLCPRRIVIGGGVAHLGEDLLFEPLRERLSWRTSTFPFFELAFGPFVDLVEIVPADLGEEVVLHGAIRLARMRGEPPA